MISVLLLFAFYAPAASDPVLTKAEAYKKIQDFFRVQTVGLLFRPGNSASQHRKLLREEVNIIW